MIHEFVYGFSQPTFVSGFVLFVLAILFSCMLYLYFTSLIILSENYDSVMETKIILMHYVLRIVDYLFHGYGTKLLHRLF